jgi:hypothetical protein
LLSPPSARHAIAIFRLRSRRLGNKVPNLTSYRPILTRRLPLHKRAQIRRQRDAYLFGFHQLSSIFEDSESFAPAINNAPCPKPGFAGENPN